MWGLRSKGAVINVSVGAVLTDLSSYKLSSEALLLDRKIKFRAGSKSAIALKHLREQFTAILGLKMRRMALNEAQERWYWLGLMVLGRTHPDESLVREVAHLQVGKST